MSEIALPRFLIAGEFINFKYRLGNRDLFKGIGTVSGAGRYLADGYGRDDLLECFAPVIENLPEKMRSPV